jgi:alkanesulfonate monooxygenase SsuD/methylene tetrahydromethanopterin reductase-like flavin-dependent oxidoreductase (luciferase family)
MLTPFVLHSQSAGAAFGAKHAECIFIGGRSPAFVRTKIDETRKLAAEQGRDPRSIKFFVPFTPILGATDAEAQAKLDEHRKYAIPEGGLALFCGISKIDVSKFPLDEDFPRDRDHPLYTGLSPRAIEALTHKPDGFETWTPRDLGNFQAIGGSGTFIAGSPQTVADEMERWINEGDVDGFNIGHVVVPGAWEDVVDLLIPELERRGYDQDYPAQGVTARENLYATPGEWKLRDDHPGRKFAFDEYGKSWE